MTHTWHIFVKDVIGECRTHRLWPRMVLLGLIVAFLLSYQTTKWFAPSEALAPTLFWLTIALSSVMAIGHAMGAERDDGNWDGLRSYPVPATAIYWAKLLFHALLLGVAQVVLIVFFAALGHGTWGPHVAILGGIGLVANLGISSVSTLIGGLVVGRSSHNGLVALLTLPVLFPLILAASEATRVLNADPTHEGWRVWTQLLVAFTTIYMTAGWMLFEFVMEE